MYKLGYRTPKSYLDWEYPEWKTADGVMLRYIKHLQPNLKRNYEILPYKRIDEMWAKIYKWEKPPVEA
jgi:hypothetical protein